MFVRRYRDLFDDAQITAPLKTDLGNGTIVESGTSIVLTAPVATDCRWEPSIVLGPVAYVEDGLAPFPDGGRPDDHQFGLLRWETRLIGATFTPIDDAPRAGLLVWVNRQNAYQLGYDFSSEYVVWQRLVADAQTNIADTGANTVNPNTTPKRLRMYYNPRSKDLGVHGQTISPDEIAAFYSEDDGGSWTFLAKESAALDEDFFGAGLYLKRSVASPTSQAVATFDYLEAADQLNPEPRFTEVGVYEDVLRIPTSGGPHKHSDGLQRGVGQLVPGPPNQTLESVGPFDVGAYEDGPMDVLTAGGPTQHQSPVFPTGAVGTGQVVPGPAEQVANAPVGPQDASAWEDKLAFPAASEELSHSTQLPEGRMMSGTPSQQQGGVIKERRAAWEDRLLVRLGGPNIEYHQNLNDSDGNAFLGGYQAHRVMLYDASNDHWGSPKVPGDGFYGADHSGSMFHNGTPTAYGDFGTLAGGLRKTAWSMSNDEPLSNGNHPDWDVTVPANDTVQVTNNTSTSNTSAWVGSNLRWYVEGDFDVSVDFAAFAHVGGTDGGAMFICYVDPDHYTYLRRRGVATSRVDSDIRLNGSWSNYAQIATGVTSGKFRFTRTGGTVRRYYDIGGGWVQIGTDQTLGAERVWFRVGFSVTGTATTASVQWSGFTKTIGTTVSSKIGWFVEGTGAHRGVRDDFPDNALIVSTDSSLDIIDADNNKLWMRFVVGNNNVLDTFTASVRPYRVEMREGILLIGFSDYSGDGGLIRVDFNLDTINVHRTEASTITGGYYKSAHGHTASGTWRAQGSIIDRNGGRDWSGDYNNWKIQSLDVQDAAAWFDSGSEYRAAAAQGVSIHRWTQWSLWLPTAPNGFEVPEWAWSSETNRMHWCHFRQSNGELMYMDSTNLYSVLKATYETRLTGGFAGIFSADTTKALPGTRTYNDQYIALPYSTSTFFLPADEGIYLVDWPIGSFVHQYGSPESSAAYKILPPDTLVIGATIADDGGTPLLVVSVYHRDLGANQLFAINLTNHTIYSRSPLVTENLQFRESAA